MEITKYKAAEVVRHIKHDLRELPDGKSYGNESIDSSLSGNNYSLIDRGKNAAEVNKYRKQLEKEIFKYNRKDLVHAVEAVIQLPDDCPEEDKERFFKECFNYICSTLPMGEKCVFVAEVHRDEKHFSPTGEMISKDHLHIMYVPAVFDNKHEGYQYKLCADELTKKARLKALHPGLQAHLNKEGISATVFRKNEGDGKQIPLTVKQLKELTAATGIKLDKSITIEDLASIIKQNISYEKRIDVLNSIIKDKDKSIELLKDINSKNIHQDNKIHEQLQIKDKENQALKEQLMSMQEAYKNKVQELQQSKEYIHQLEQQKQNTVEKEQASWGHNNSWGNKTQGWGTHEKEEEKTW